MLRMQNNTSDRRIRMQTTPRICGGKQNPNCRGHTADKSDDRALDRASAGNSDCNRTWRHTREAEMAAESRLLLRKRGSEEESEVEKKLRGGAGVGCFISEMRFRVRGETWG